MKDWDDESQNKYNQAMGALKGLDVEPSPYMKTRILANVQAAEEKAKPGFQWLQILVGSLGAAALAVVISFQMMQSPSGTVVALGTPYMVKADLRVFEELQPSYVKVELVGNVEFSSEKFKHISEMRSLTMSWERLAGKQYLPVVVKGVEKGESHVKIHFYDKDNNIIKTQDFEFDFQKGTS